jgi:hypothetical protein
MMEVNFNAGPGSDGHQCESYRDGDWIVFRCPICLEYERRINWRTGAMTVRSSDDAVRHTGTHVPSEYKSAFENTN